MLHRVPNARFGEPIGDALGMLDGCADWFQGVRFWCADPVFTGLHDMETFPDGRSHRDTTHCVYPWAIPRPASDRAITIVMPAPEPTHIVMHELGHVLDWRLEFTHRAQPITNYAATSDAEAFAEAWAGWWFDYGDQATLAGDHPTLRLFERITGRNVEGRLI